MKSNHIKRLESLRNNLGYFICMEFNYKLMNFKSLTLHYLLILKFFTTN